VEEYRMKLYEQNINQYSNRLFAMESPLRSLEIILHWVEITFDRGRFECGAHPAFSPMAKRVELSPCFKHHAMKTY
jgi:hypothetical protein